MPHELLKGGGTNLHLGGSCGPFHRWWPSLVWFDLSRWDFFEGTDSAIIKTLMCLRGRFLSHTLSLSQVSSQIMRRWKRKYKERKKNLRDTPKL